MFNYAIEQTKDENVNKTKDKKNKVIARFAFQMFHKNVVSCIRAKVNKWNCKKAEAYFTLYLPAK